MKQYPEDNLFRVNFCLSTTIEIYWSDFYNLRCLTIFPINSPHPSVKNNDTPINEFQEFNTAGRPLSFSTDFPAFHQKVAHIDGTWQAFEFEGAA